MLLCAGDLVLDVVVFADKRPRGGAEVTGRIRLLGGGSAANVAAWATHLGTPARFVGCVGRDWMGAWLVDELRGRGVEVVEVRTPEPTGVVAVWVEGRERTMICAPGANRLLPAVLLEDAVWENVRHVHFTGYSLLRPETRALVGKALARARKQGCSVSLDPSATDLLLSAVGRRDLQQLMCSVDILFPNREEALALAKARRVDQAARRLAQSVPVVCIKNGHRGCWLAYEGEVEKVPTRPVAVVDPTGAGDAFAAGFLTAWVEGKGVQEAVRRALEAGAQAVQGVGGRPPPRWQGAADRANMP